MLGQAGPGGRSPRRCQHWRATATATAPPTTSRGGGCLPCLGRDHPTRSKVERIWPKTGPFWSSNTLRAPKCPLRPCAVELPRVADCPARFPAPQPAHARGVGGQTGREGRAPCALPELHLPRRGGRLRLRQLCAEGLDLPQRLGQRHRLTARRAGPGGWGRGGGGALLCLAVPHPPSPIGGMAKMTRFWTGAKRWAPKVVPISQEVQYWESLGKPWQEFQIFLIQGTGRKWTLWGNLTFCNWLTKLGPGIFLRPGGWVWGLTPPTGGSGAEGQVAPNYFFLENVLKWPDFIWVGPPPHSQGCSGLAHITPFFCGKEPAIQRNKPAG